MDVHYADLLERTKLPHPSLQRYAVISIFQKLKAAPPSLGLESDPGRHALSYCLLSASTAVADQAVRELCRFVREGLLDPSEGLVELQSALEGCEPQFVPLFVKGIGFLWRFAFRSDLRWGRRFDPISLHPFVKVLLCRVEVQAELIQQILLFISHNTSAGMMAVSQFLRPFLMFSVIQIPFSASSASFVGDLFSSVASLCCSLPSEGIGIIRLLTSCLEYFPRKNEKEFRQFMHSAEYVVDALVVVLKQTINIGAELKSDAEACRVELLKSLLSVCTSLNIPRGGIEIVLELLKRLLVAQKELGLDYLPEFALVSLSMSFIFTQVEFEHEHLSILKLLIFLIQWKTGIEHHSRGVPRCLSVELLFLFPAVSLLSSPSKTVKAAASSLLVLIEGLVSELFIEPEKVQISSTQFPSASKPEFLAFRLLNHLWHQEPSSFEHLFPLEFTCNDVLQKKQINSESVHWTPNQRDDSIMSIIRRKLTFSSQLYGDKLVGMPLLMSPVVCILVMHPNLGASAASYLASFGSNDPNLAIPMLLSILFYARMLSYKKNSPEILLRLLETVPSLTVHSAMVPLIIQTLSPMLHKDAKPTLYAAAVRLLCKTWMVTGRAFGTLQGLLDAQAFSDFISEIDICISIAASVCDVCRCHPDRGVDLILSVSSSIESQNSTIKALGFQSLAYLCEADVVDFYTAWNVISKLKLVYSVDPVLAYGLCTLLRWGAVDAEAYPEASKNVLQVLWDVATSKCPSPGSLWVKARICAFQSLSSYEIMHVQEAIPDFKERNVKCFLSEDNPQVLEAMEGLEVKILNFEHKNRRRVLKEKRVIVHKVEKILDTIPRLIFTAGKQKTSTSELPGAALLSFVFTPDLRGQALEPKELRKLHTAYENALLELAESLNISRNVLFALLAVQSWKPFVERWMRAVVILMDKVPSDVSERSVKAANDIFKVMCKVAANSVPRVAENIALAIGALCMVAPPSAHAVTLAASKFLLFWLYEYQHEYRQWSAAISLGLISNCFHATDRLQKFDIITALIKVLGSSKSHLVKGACGVGLGFACQGLLSRVQVDEYPKLEGRNSGVMEATLLGNIIRALSLMIRQLCPSTSDALKSLNEYFPPNGDDASGDQDALSCHACNNNFVEDLWGISGLVLGLGYSIVAIYRTGANGAVLKVKDMLLSWVADADGCSPNSFSTSEIMLSIGSCIALPTVLAFCQEVELINNNSDVLENYISLISDLLKIQKSEALYQNLLMASCIGAGSFFSFIMNDGVQSVSFEDIKRLLEILRSVYTRPFPPIVQLGGMLGVVNALGACAGDLTQMHPQSVSLNVSNAKQGSLFIRGPVLTNSVCESLLTSVVQEMVLLAKDSQDQQIRSYAAWAISFLRHQWLSKEFQSATGPQSCSSDSKSCAQNFTEDSLVWKLSLWLRDYNFLQMGEFLLTSTTAAVLRCLSKAPRLPAMGWGAIIRACMRYETQYGANAHEEVVPKSLREECIHFSVAHANANTAFLLFLDELTDLSRFRRLELELQLTLLCHLSDLLRLFSGTRQEKLLEDMVNYFGSSSSSYLDNEQDQKSLLRVSFWKGLHLCFAEAPMQSTCLSKIEMSLECLLYLLPVLTADDTSRRQAFAEEEWSEAIVCLAKAEKDWLMGLLQVSDLDFVHGGSYNVNVVIRILARARLVRIGCFPASLLEKLKGYILNARSEGLWWSVLVEVAAAVSSEASSIKRQWILDALEISCMSKYPLTALRFIGLLAGSCCKFMPLLIVDPATVLNDLPVTLPSLMTDSNWSSSASAIVDRLWALTERICIWASSLNGKDGGPGQHEIDGSEAQSSALLAQVLHQTCVLLKDYLPFDKQLRLANILVP